MTHRIPATHFDQERMLEQVRQLFERYRRVAAERERRFARRGAEDAPSGHGEDRRPAAASPREAGR